MKFNKDVKEKLLFHVTINVIVIRNMIERLKVGDIMGKIIAIANQKGGVGKTTTSVNLGAGLAQVGKKVLLVDIDAQGNATTGVGIEKSELDQCIYNVLVEDADVQGVIQKTATENLDVLPATIQLAGAEIELVPTISREVRLQGHYSQFVMNMIILLSTVPVLRVIND